MPRSTDVPGGRAIPETCRRNWPIKAPLAGKASSTPRAHAGPVNPIQSAGVSRIESKRKPAGSYRIVVPAQEIQNSSLRGVGGRIRGAQCHRMLDLSPHFSETPRSGQRLRIPKLNSGIRGSFAGSGLQMLNDVAESPLIRQLDPTGDGRTGCAHNRSRIQLNLAAHPLVARRASSRTHTVSSPIPVPGGFATLTLVSSPPSHPAI